MTVGLMRQPKGGAEMETAAQTRLAGAIGRETTAWQALDDATAVIKAVLRAAKTAEAGAAKAKVKAAKDAREAALRVAEAAKAETEAADAAWSAAKMEAAKRSSL